MHVCAKKCGVFCVTPQADAVVWTRLFVSLWWASVAALSMHACGLWLAIAFPANKWPRTARA